jgi:hypothetical protein
MTTVALESVRPRGMVWTGRILSGIAAAFMTFDAVLHLANPAVVKTAFAQLGFPDSQSVTIGAIALMAVIIYLTPRTAVLGAVLLTGYLGGAIAIQLRIGAPAFSLVFPLIVAALFWGGLALRDQRVGLVFGAGIGLGQH